MNPTSLSFSPRVKHNMSNVLLPLGCINNQLLPVQYLQYKPLKTQNSDFIFRVITAIN